MIVVGIGVSRVKYEVVFLRKNLKHMINETEQCLDDIKILGAEWSYLNNPDRLKKLSEKYIPDMKPIENNQIMRYNKIMGSSDIVFQEHNSLGSLIDEALDSDMKDSSKNQTKNNSVNKKGGKK